MNTQIQAPNAEQVQTWRATGRFVSEDDLPMPPDNFEIWNSFPEDFRDKVTNQFTRGIDHEYDRIRDRVAEEYATARRRQQEREARRAAGTQGGRR